MSDKYLYGCGNDEFINGFKKLYGIMVEIYKDMQCHPEENDVPVQYPMNLLYNFGKAGEITDNKLIIDPSIPSNIAAVRAV